MGLLGGSVPRFDYKLPTSSITWLAKHVNLRFDRRASGEPPGLLKFDVIITACPFDSEVRIIGCHKGLRISESGH
jgi:hypothetical protein